MSERRIIVPGRVVNYSGFFNGKELYKLIKGIVTDLGYDAWLEKEHNEKNTKTHKQVELLYLPEMKVSDYILLQIEISITYMNLKSGIVEYKGKKIKIDDGELEINFRGFMITDYEDRWENKPHYFFIRTIMDNFVLKPQISKYEKMIEEHIKHLYNDIREYLNTTKYS